MTQTIQLTRHDNGTAIITFNRPEALNALNLEAMTAFQEAILALRDDASLRALILTGAGERAFCSGGDLVELAPRVSEADALAFITTMGDALLALERLPVPVIAAINGYALGGGSEIALACDLRVVDQNVRMGMVQVHMKVTPGWGAGQRLLRVVGYAKALELLLRGHTLHASELLALGLANRVTDAGQALPEALAFAAEIAQQPRELVAGIKALLQAGLNHPYEEALQIERSIFPPLWAGDPHLQAVAAFLERQSARRQASE